MKYKVEWDTDGEVVDLPEVVEASDEIETALDDLSNEYGWCILALLPLTDS